MQRFSKKASTAPPDSPEPTAMLEIIILQRFSVIVIFILTASLLQIHTDLLNFGSAARHYSLDYLYSITGPTKERMFFSSIQKVFPIFSNFIDKRTCRDFRQVKTCPMLYSLKLFSFKNNFLIFYSENPNHYTKCSS